jgi:hypothetical protein
MIIKRVGLSIGYGLLVFALYSMSGQKNNIGGTAAIAASFGFFSGFTFGKDERKS